MPEHPSTVDVDAPPASVRRVAYPGELGAAPTPLSFDLPADWEVAPVPGALAIARARASSGAFPANLVVSVDRAGAHLTLVELAASVLADTDRRAERLAIRSEWVAEVDGRPALCREQEVLVTGEPAPLTQFVLLTLVAVPAAAARDCIQVTVTGAAGERVPLDAVFTQLRGSLRLGA